MKAILLSTAIALSVLPAQAGCYGECSDQNYYYMLKQQRILEDKIDRLEDEQRRSRQPFQNSYDPRY